jgi:hypothetical protein
MKFRMDDTKYLREDHWERIKDSIPAELKPGIVGCSGDKRISELPGIRRTVARRRVDKTKTPLDLRT